MINIAREILMRAHIFNLSQLFIKSLFVKCVNDEMLGKETLVKNCVVLEN